MNYLIALLTISSYKLTLAHSPFSVKTTRNAIYLFLIPHWNIKYCLSIIQNDAS